MFSRRKCNPVRIEDGVLYLMNTETGEQEKVIKNPAVIIDNEADIIFKHGELEQLKISLLKYKQAFTDAGSDASIFKLIDLSKFSITEQAYIINRMMNFSVSGFIPAFYGRRNDDDISEWLKLEMEKVPM